jgi:glycerophosphoryl diester phosphodiesterase
MTLDRIHVMMKFAVPLLLLALVAPAAAVEMPDGGVCAHRGDNAIYPENTLAAFREAIWRGAQQIELDVDRTSDGQLVIMHDSTVDRTTDGSGSVSSFTLAGIKALDAGSWMGTRFTGERVPTLAEALSIMPENVWINVHMKSSYAATYAAAMEIVNQNRQHQAFLAVTASQKPAVLAVEADTGKNLLMCNMEGQRMGTVYVNETISGGFDFLQFSSDTTPPELPSASDMQLLHAAGVKASYYTAVIRGTLNATRRDYVRSLINAGIDFPLIDDTAVGPTLAEEFLYEPVKPAFRGNVHTASLGANVIVNPGAETWMNDYHNPMTAAAPASGYLLTRDREIYGWNDVACVTNEPFGAANTPSATAFPSATFGENAFVGGHLTGTRWIEQTIDLAALVASIDQGIIHFDLSGWLGGLHDQRDYTALTASFQDADGDELAIARLSTLNPADWGNGTSMVQLATEGTVPVGARSINVRLWFNAQTGGFANGMADDLSLVLSTIDGESASVPEPASVVLLALFAPALILRQRKRSRASRRGTSPRLLRFSSGRAAAESGGTPLLRPASCERLRGNIGACAEAESRK